MRRQRGSVFVISLAVLAGVVAVLASLAASQHTAVQAQYGRQDRARAKRAAESGIQRALAELANVPSGNPEAQTTTTANTATGNATTLQDEWAQLGQNGDERFVTGTETFRLQIVDACARINVNTAPEAQLERLPLTTEQIQSLLDFREANQVERPQGAKDQFYNTLPEPYNAKLRLLDSVDELLQIRDWTPNTLFRPITDIQSSNPLPTDANGDTIPLIDVLTVHSYSPQIDPTGQARINVNTGNAQQRQQRLQQAGFSPQAIAQITARNNYASLGEVAALPTLSDQDRQLVLDYLTTNAAPRVAGLININTASEEILATVPGITIDVAQAIVQRQSQGFASLGELVSVPGVTPEVLQQAAGGLSAISQVFIVRVLGEVNQSQFALEAVVDVAEGSPKVRQIFEVPYADATTRWNWSPESTTETVLRERQ